MKKLSDWLDKKGMKQTFFAKQIGINKTSLYCILRRGVTPSIGLAYRIEKKTGGHITLYDWLDKSAREYGENDDDKNQANTK